ncbi:hypothetical protein ACIBQ1_38305 [Nonomuraea sp. NPDC050153]|uniref:hypothetical protein n=1 Tax=Nonomuraea sp. NPDC050153 TaxID=3364359 RepID=UPI00378758D1
MVVLVLWGSPAGCAQAGDPQLQTGAREPSQTATGISAVPVTRADYEDAVGHTRDCMRKSAVQLVSYGWDPIDQQDMILTYRAPGVPEATVFDVARKCRARHLNAVEARYRNDHQALMIPELMKRVQHCLKAKGVSVTGQERNPGDLLAVVSEDRLMDLLDCVHQNANQLYPTLPIEFP